MTKNSITTQTLKGFRDFLPDEAARRLWLKQRLRQIFGGAGFLPLETPALEYLEIFAGQIGEDEKLFYSFTDQGGRKVALRYDQTVPTCRVVAKYASQLTMPFKRYQIQPVWRAEKPQQGRFREFVQCDADIFGEAGVEADAEVVALSIDIYRQLGFTRTTVLVNDRALFAEAGLPYPVIAAIDKLDKIGRKRVIAEIAAKGYTTTGAEKILDTVLGFQPTPRLEIIFKALSAAGFKKEWYRFQPTLARSFSYSTGPIWEVVVPRFPGSVLGGERFDGLVSQFTKTPIPATGFGLGFDRTLAALEENKLIPASIQKPLVLVTVFSPETWTDSIRVTQQLRQAAINTEVYTNPKERLAAQLKYASRKRVQLAVILGPDELAKKQATLKNLETKTQQSVDLALLERAITEQLEA